MNCEKVRSYLPIIAAGDLDSRKFSGIHEHLAGCMGCQKSFETTRRLRSLLALKRYEQPDEFFFRTYVSEFHRRLLSKIVQKKSTWVWMRETFSWVMWPRSVRLGFSFCAVVSLILVSFYVVHIPVGVDMSQSGKIASHQNGRSSHHQNSSIEESFLAEVPSTSNQLVLAENHSLENSIYVMDHVNYNSVHGPVVLDF